MRNCAAVQSRPFNIVQILQDAVTLHQRGRLREAEKLYARALKAAPDNFDALHLLGLVKAQSGQMGEAYRLMSAALKINPNTAHKVIGALTAEGLLEVRPGIGTVVATPSSRAEDRAYLLKHELEQLVVEAKKLGLSLSDVTGAVEDHWGTLEAAPAVSRRHS